MIEPYWKRIAGLQVQDDGVIAAVWIAHDKDADTLHLYHCAVFKREVLAVVAEGLRGKNPWIPIAWPKEAKEIAEKLLERKCNTLPDPVADSVPASEVTSLDIEERMRTGRFKVVNRLESWLDEFRTFTRQDGAVPRGSHPLMAATRHAVESLDWARAKPKKSINYPEIAIL